MFVDTGRRVDICENKYIMKTIDNEESGLQNPLSHVVVCVCVKLRFNVCRNLTIVSLYTPPLCLRLCPCRLGVSRFGENTKKEPSKTAQGLVSK